MWVIRPCRYKEVGAVSACMATILHQLFDYLVASIFMNCFRVPFLWISGAVQPFAHLFIPSFLIDK